MERLAELYEVVWTGATHRTIPPPPVAPLKPRRPQEPAIARFEQVLNAVPADDWGTIQGIARTANVSKDSATRYLAALWATGQIERKRSIRERPGRELRYRRVR